MPAALARRSFFGVTGHGRMSIRRRGTHEQNHDQNGITGAVHQGVCAHQADERAKDVDRNRDSSRHVGNRAAGDTPGAEQDTGDE